jgi:anti-anti-sigma factor
VSELWLHDDAGDSRGHVVSVHGDLAGQDAEALVTAVDLVLQAGAPAVIVDLTDSAFLDSSGVAALIGCWRVVSWQRVGDPTALAGGQRQLGLVVPTDADTRRLLQTRGLERFFSVTPSRDETFSSLGLAA